MGQSIKYIREIFRKTNMLEMLVFRKILRTYLMDGLYSNKMTHSLREMCPDTDQKNLRIRTLFTL